MDLSVSNLITHKVCSVCAIVAHVYDDLGYMVGEFPARTRGLRVRFSRRSVVDVET